MIGRGSRSFGRCNGNYFCNDKMLSYTNEVKLDLQERILSKQNNIDIDLFMTITRICLNDEIPVLIKKQMRDFKDTKWNIDWSKITGKMRPI